MYRSAPGTGVVKPVRPRAVRRLICNAAHNVTLDCSWVAPVGGRNGM
jgi:hypothetical protein